MARGALHLTAVILFGVMVIAGVVYVAGCLALLAFTWFAIVTTVR